MNEAHTTFESDGRTAVTASRIPPAATTATEEPSLGDLFRQLADDSSSLIKQEINLAKTEVKETVSQAVRDAVWIPVWGAVALVGSLVLVTFLVLLIGDLLNNYWLAALIVGVVFTALGGMMAMSSLNKLKSLDMKPETTIRTLEQDKRWAKEEVQDFKRDITR
jgi:uncharacterized membrane protein YqjE